MLCLLPLQSLARTEQTALETIHSTCGVEDTAKTRCGAPTAPTALKEEWWCSEPLGGRSLPWLSGQWLVSHRAMEMQVQQFELGMDRKRFAGVEGESRLA